MLGASWSWCFFTRRTHAHTIWNLVPFAWRMIYIGLLSKGKMITCKHEVPAIRLCTPAKPTINIHVQINKLQAAFRHWNVLVTWILQGGVQMPTALLRTVSETAAGLRWISNTPGQHILLQMFFESLPYRGQYVRWTENIWFWFSLSLAKVLATKESLANCGKVSFDGKKRAYFNFQPHKSNSTSNT